MDELCFTWYYSFTTFNSVEEANCVGFCIRENKAKLNFPLLIPSLAPLSFIQAKVHPPEPELKQPVSILEMSLELVETDSDAASAG